MYAAFSFLTNFHPFSSIVNYINMLIAYFLPHRLAQILVTSMLALEYISMKLRGGVSHMHPVYSYTPILCVTYYTVLRFTIHTKRMFL